ncbi:MAG: Sua5/YciO/YrdC/YwlC family protein [Mariprofundaceae bacterium]|nr:Sua5/YciO/YrdC/YwlC family protein [Mariprofundaceae bacterium]
MLRKPSPRTSRKLNSLRAAPLLKRGGLIGHYTSTLPGMACLPETGRAIWKMQHFKRRKGPFLLLADSKQRAGKYIRWYPAPLRKLIRTQWPGHTTLVVPGRPGLPATCYHKGMLAIRVDADAACRRLARACGGLLLSSSLNRRGGIVRRPCYGVQMRWHGFLSGRAGMGTSSGVASVIYRVDHRGLQKVR